jgi:hypothetical protein
MNDVQNQITEGITFRIPSQSINQLREESKKKQMSLNTLVNQILKDHLYWHAYAAQAKMFHIPRSTFSRLVDNLTEDELSKFARNANLPVESVLQTALPTPRNTGLPSLVVVFPTCRKV